MAAYPKIDFFFILCIMVTPRGQSPTVQGKGVGSCSKGYIAKCKM